MAKTLKSAAQLTALINAELSKHPVCNHTGAEGIEPIVDVRIPHNWTCKFLRRSSEPSPDCQQVLAAIVHEFSRSMISTPRNELYLRLDCGTGVRFLARRHNFA